MQGKIKSYVDSSTDADVNISIKFSKDYLIGVDRNILVKKLRLRTVVSEHNMHAFDERERLVRLVSPLEVIDRYFDVRLEKYAERKKLVLEKLEEDLKYAKAMVGFIFGNIDGTINLRNKTEHTIHKSLEERGLPTKDGSYEYLLSMPIRSLSHEKATSLREKLERLESERNILANATPQTLWRAELDELSQFLSK